MKYKVTVTLIARKTFTYEVDERNRRKAEDAAFNIAIAEFTGEDVEQDDVEVIQLTNLCSRCDKEYAHPEAEAASPEHWHEDMDYCAECGVILEAEEKLAGKI